MADMTRQQFCAELQISESTVRRLEREGLPFTLVGSRPRYDLADCKRWLKEHQCQPGSTKTAVGTSELWSAAGAFTESYRKAHLRVMPSN